MPAIAQALHMDRRQQLCCTSNLLVRSIVLRRCVSSFVSFVLLFGLMLLTTAVGGGSIPNEFMFVPGVGDHLHSHTSLPETKRLPEYEFSGTLTYFSRCVFVSLCKIKYAMDSCCGARQN